MLWSLVWVHGAEGPEADSRESGVTGLGLTIFCIPHRLAFNRVDRLRALGSLSYVIN